MASDAPLVGIPTLLDRCYDPSPVKVELPRTVHAKAATIIAASVARQHDRYSTTCSTPGLALRRTPPITHSHKFGM